MTEPPLTLRHPKLQSLLEFWRRQQADAAVPVAEDLDPEDLKEWLGNLLIMDVIEGDNFIYSYYGESFERAFGESMVGKSIELLPDAQRALLHDEYERARIGRAPIARVYTAEFDGKLATWERLVLPLSTNGEKVDKLMVSAYQLGGH